MRLPGVSEGEEDGSTSAPPAEKLNRGSAFLFWSEKKTNLGTAIDSNVVITEARTRHTSAGGGALFTGTGGQVVQQPRAT